VNAPADPLHERVEIPGPVTLVGARVQIRPVDGDTIAVRLTTPLKPCSAVTVTVETPETPARTGTEVGFATTVKSWDVNETVAETLLGPFVPVTVTV
jgi:hypothetical protein